MLSLILTLAFLDAPPIGEQFEALKVEYTSKQAEWDRRYTGGENRLPEAKIDWAGRYRDYPAWAYAPRFLALAEAHAGDPAATDALFWVADLIGSVGDRDRDLSGPLARTLEIVGRSHVDDPRVDALCRTVTTSGSMPAAATFLQTVAERAASPDVRGRAALGHARFLASWREVALQPWFDRTGSAPVEQAMIDRLDPAYVRLIRTANLPALLAEAEREFDRVKQDYGAVIADARPGRDQTIAQVVAEERFELLYLGVGQMAPDIVGTDVDDQKFKLADYRGRVVVLTFSGNWCGPCVGMYPAERALVERYKGRPFAILSVSTDSTKETLRKAIQQGDITWRCWWDGGIDGPITSAWNTRSFPTVYLIDAAGVIREKSLRGDQLDAAVARLMDPVTPAKP